MTVVSTSFVVVHACWLDARLLLLQGLMDFVLTHASQLLAGGYADTAVCLSAAQTISQMCEVAEAQDMAVQEATLKGLLQLVQQAMHSEVMPYPSSTMQTAQS